MLANDQTALSGIERQDLIVLIHGLAGNSWWLVLMRRRLRRQGYRCVIWTYPSFKKSIGFHGERFRSFLLNDLANEPRVHLVAHSMGSIVVRSAIASGCPENLGRVVFLAPPNAGGPAAYHVHRKFGGWFPTIVELSNQRDSYVNSLPEWNGRDLGIIAAKYDILVPMESTRLVNQSDYAVVSTTHIGLAFSKEALRLILNFLRDGRFEPQSNVVSSDVESQAETPISSGKSASLSESAVERVEHVD